jgi:hypothetical protein
MPSATVPFQLEWIQYHSDDLGASFEYPEAYETGPCGHLMTSEREGDFAAYGFQGDQIIFFDGSTIEISMKSPWNGDFDEHLESLLWQTYYAEEALESDLLIDGLPAVRIERTFQGPAATAGDVVVLIVHEDRLYSFRWAEMNWVWCDVEGMGEYGIFEHILASWHFDQ